MNARRKNRQIGVGNEYMLHECGVGAACVRTALGALHADLYRHLDRSVYHSTEMFTFGRGRVLTISSHAHRSANHAIKS